MGNTLRNARQLGKNWVKLNELRAKRELQEEAFTKLRKQAETTNDTLREVRAQAIRDIGKTAEEAVKESAKAGKE